ncbi:hypothetical protein Gorai_023035 [Gossypium raimondii]|uniref:DUF4283 domain-containing protein n=1 Tax=Gossypium raimondii TaxID=29730 RepID=A0A7J8NVI4_GOSRA|nr:hypothetical protein [Gossypium raimondii]
MGRDEIFILKEELVQLTVKSLRCTNGAKLDPVSASPFWLKIGPCPSECDKKDLMHAIESTFGGIMRLEIKEAKKKSVNRLGKWKLDLVDTREDKVPIIDMTCVKRSRVGDKDHDGDGSTNEVMVTLELCSNPSNLIPATAIKPTKCNENHQLKCPWSRESTDN